MLEFNKQEHFISKVEKNVPLNNTFHVMNDIFILTNKPTKCVWHIFFYIHYVLQWLWDAISVKIILFQISIVMKTMVSGLWQQVIWLANTNVLDELLPLSSGYTLLNKNPSAWNFLSPEPEVTCGTVAIIIWVILLSPYMRICGVSLSSIHYNRSHRVYINRRRQYICLIWN